MKLVVVLNLIILTLVLLVNQINGSCAILQSLLVIIEGCLVQDAPNTCFYERFLSSPAADHTCAALQSSFGDCTSTIRDLLIVSGNTCEAQLKSFPHSSDLTEQQLDVIVGEACNQTVAQTLKNFCQCPEGTDLTIFTPLVTCVFEKPALLSQKELKSYHPYNDCLDAKSLAGMFDVNSNGEPDVCETTGAFSKFHGCEKTVDDVIATFTNATGVGSNEDCESLFLGPFLSSLCNVNFGEALQEVCIPQKCTFENFITCFTLFGLDAVTVISIGCAILVVLILVIVLLARKQRKRRSLNTYNSKASFHSKSSFPSYQSQQKNPSPETFVTQNQNNFSNQESLGMTNRRKQQLLAFYEEYDPERKNKFDHVEKLFRKYKFENIAKALQQKYGILPSGWEAELRRMNLMDQHGSIMIRSDVNLGPPPGLSNQKFSF